MNNIENKVVYINTSNRKKTPSELIELKAVIDRGDYAVPSIEIAKKMLSARVFHTRKHG